MGGLWGFGKMRKLKSVKFWVVVWACALITYMVVANRVEWTQLGILLATIPLAYIPANVWQKKIEEKCVEKDC